MKYLDNKVESLRKLSSRSQSPPNPPPPPPAAPEASLSLAGTRASPRCHGCHGPIAEYHTYYPHGIGKCPLQHYDLCLPHVSSPLYVPGTGSHMSPVSMAPAGHMFPNHRQGSPQPNMVCMRPPIPAGQLMQMQGGRGFMRPVGPGFGNPMRPLTQRQRTGWSMVKGK